MKRLWDIHLLLLILHSLLKPVTSQVNPGLCKHIFVVILSLSLVWPFSHSPSSVRVAATCEVHFPIRTRMRFWAVVEIVQTHPLFSNKVTVLCMRVGVNCRQAESVFLISNGALGHHYLGSLAKDGLAPLTGCPGEMWKHTGTSHEAGSVGVDTHSTHICTTFSSSPPLVFGHILQGPWGEVLVLVPHPPVLPT